MIYKTHKDVYYTVAGRMNLDDELIRKVGDFYWQDISDRIARFEHRQIYLNKLGTLTMRKAKFQSYLKNMGSIERLMRSTNRSEESIKLALENAEIKKVRVQKLLDEWEEIKKIREKYYEKKYAYRDLQKHRKNMGGVEEQPIQD